MRRRQQPLDPDTARWRRLAGVAAAVFAGTLLVMTLVADEKHRLKDALLESLPALPSSMLSASGASSHATADTMRAIESKTGLSFPEFEALLRDVDAGGGVAVKAGTAAAAAAHDAATMLEALVKEHVEPLRKQRRLARAFAAASGLGDAEVPHEDDVYLPEPSTVKCHQQQDGFDICRYENVCIDLPNAHSGQRGHQLLLVGSEVVHPSDGSFVPPPHIAAMPPGAEKEAALANAQARHRRHISRLRPAHAPELFLPHAARPVVGMPPWYHWAFEDVPESFWSGGKEPKPEVEIHKRTGNAFVKRARPFAGLFALGMVPPNQTVPLEAGGAYEGQVAWVDNLWITHTAMGPHLWLWSESVIFPLLLAQAHNVSQGLGLPPLDFLMVDNTDAYTFFPRPGEHRRLREQGGGGQQQGSDSSTIDASEGGFPSPPVPPGTLLRYNSEPDAPPLLGPHHAPHTNASRSLSDRAAVFYMGHDGFWNPFLYASEGDATRLWALGALDSVVTYGRLGLGPEMGRAREIRQWERTKPSKGRRQRRAAAAAAPEELVFGPPEAYLSDAADAAPQTSSGSDAARNLAADSKNKKKDPNQPDPADLSPPVLEAFAPTIRGFPDLSRLWSRLVAGGLIPGSPNHADVPMSKLGPNTAHKAAPPDFPVRLPYDFLTFVDPEQDASMAPYARRGTRLLFNSYDMAFPSLPYKVRDGAGKQGLRWTRQDGPPLPSTPRRICAKRLGYAGEKVQMVAGPIEANVVREFGYRALGVELPPLHSHFPPRRAVIVDRGRTSKGALKGRAFLNVEEMVAVFKRYDIAVDVVTDADLVELSFKQQVAKLNRYGLAVISHGAGEANLAWLPPRSAVIEIFPHGMWCPAFTRMFSALGHNVFPIYSRLKGPGMNYKLGDPDLDKKEGGEAGKAATCDARSIGEVCLEYYCWGPTKAATLVVPIYEFEHTLLRALETIGVKKFPPPPPPEEDGSGGELADPFGLLEGEARTPHDIFKWEPGIYTKRRWKVRRPAPPPADWKPDDHNP